MMELMATILPMAHFLGLAVAASSPGEDGWKQVMAELKKTNSKLEQMKNDMKTLANQLDRYDKKIEWAIADGCLAPRNSSWVEEKYLTMLDKLSHLQHNLVTPVHCGDIYQSGKTGSGVYAIFPFGDNTPVSVYCDHRHGGGWTVIQRRYDGSEDFNRKWDKYAEGFGDKSKEHWLGLNLIHRLTTLYKMNLYIEIGYFVTNQTYHAQYDNFNVLSQFESFRLLVTGYSGNVGDSMAYHNGAYFYTRDRNNEDDCATDRGGWWHVDCTSAALNGIYSAMRLQGEERIKSMFWWDHPNPQLDGYTPLKATLMKIRPADFGQ